MLGRYSRIEKVTYKDKSEGYLLTGEDNCKNFEVDMNSDFWFDEIGIEKRELVKTVTSLQEVIDFCKEHSISFDSDDYVRLGDHVLRVGGGGDMDVNENLEFSWQEF